MLLVGCESMALHRANSKPSQPIVPESIKNHASDPPWMAFQEKESPDKRRICNDFPTLEVASQVFTDSDSASQKQAIEVTCTPQTNASKVQPSHHQNTNLVVPARPEQPNPALQIIPEDSLFSKVHSIPTGKAITPQPIDEGNQEFLEPNKLGEYTHPSLLPVSSQIQAEGQNTKSTVGLALFETTKNSPTTQPFVQEKITRTAFTLSKVVLCKRVEGFGQFDPIDPGYKFMPGSIGGPGERVLVYAELGNVSSLLEDGWFRTHLAGRVEILDQHNKKTVCILDFPSREDKSRTERRDQHLVFCFHVPPNLAPGLYSLRVTAQNSVTTVSEPGENPPMPTATLDFLIDVIRSRNGQNKAEFPERSSP